MSTNRDQCQVVTYAPGFKNKRYLGSLGHVMGLTYDFTLPGGSSAMSCLLQVPPAYRTDAMNDGRICQVQKGASILWDGQLTEAVPTKDGWQVTAVGVGASGADYMAFYSSRNDTGCSTNSTTTVTDTHAIASDLQAPITGGSIPASTVVTAVNVGVGYTISQAATASASGLTFNVGIYTLDSPVNQAIARGLRWKHTAAGGAAFTGWLVTAPDVASITITDHMTNATSKAGLTWNVDRFGKVTIGAIPSVPDRLLVCTDPIPRTLYGLLTTLWGKFNLSDDGNGNTVDQYTVASNQTLINRFNPHEQYEDITAATPSPGTMTQAAAAAYLQSMMNLYTAAAWAGPFTAVPGQLLNMGGVPVDIATETAGHVVRLISNDAPYGGQIAAGAIQFPVGQYAYDEDSQTAAITPMQSFRSDIGTVISNFARWE